MFDAVPAKGQLLISLDVRASDFLPIGERWLINRVMASADNEGESNLEMAFADNEGESSLENNVSVDSVLNRVEPPLPGTVDLQVTQIAVTDSIVVEDGVEFPSASFSASIHPPIKFLLTRCSGSFRPLIHWRK